MIVVLDTNVLLSGIAATSSYPRIIYRAWLDAHFELATCEAQLKEVRDASRKSYFTERLKPHDFGLLVNSLRQARFISQIKRQHTALDPTDSFLLDLAAAAKAHYLVTGDKKSGLLQRGKIGSTRVLTPAAFFEEVIQRSL
jgi:putative PIN family toxin of toxin-antitoxin system